MIKFDKRVDHTIVNGCDDLHPIIVTSLDPIKIYWIYCESATRYSSWTFTKLAILFTNFDGLLRHFFNF
jgi:hypothetical protein